MNDPVQKHDADVEDLNKRVVDLHDVLVKAIRNMTEARIAMPTWNLAEIQADMRDYLSSSKKDNDGAAILAQYIVNHKHQLGSEYTTATAWNRHRDKLMSLLSVPSGFIQTPYSEAQKSEGSLIKSIASLCDELRAIRKGLSFEHDVPYMVA